MNKRGPLIAIGVAAGVIALVVVASSLSGGSGGTAADGPPIQQPASPFGDSPVEPGDVQQLTPELASVSRDWITDFSKTTIEFDVLVICIRRSDRFRPIVDPQFETIA